MNVLRSYEQRIVQACFARDISESLLHSLGNPHLWKMYRRLVRYRFQELCLDIFSRTSHALGKEQFQEYFDMWLDINPPKTRFFWELPLVFFDSIFHEVQKREELRIQDLWTYEKIRWKVRHISRQTRKVVDISFDLPIVLNPTVRLVNLDYAVDEIKHDHNYEKTHRHLCIYQDSNFRVKTLRLNNIAHKLVYAWLEDTPLSLQARVIKVCEQENVQINSEFIQGLADMLQDYIHRGIILGSASNE